MTIRCDWHIHSQHSPCGKPGTPLALVCDQARRCGLTDFGITDHLNDRKSEPALRRCRQEYDALADRKGFHFGVEVGCLRLRDLEVNDSLGESGSVGGVQEGGPENGLTLYLPPELLDELKVEYIIGGAHLPLGATMERDAVIRSYHRQNLFLAAHPLVDVVAHPWRWMGHWQDEKGRYLTLPWFDDFRVIPRSMHDEFAAAAVEHGTAVEINAHACLLNPDYPEGFRAQYREYLAGLKERGVRFSLGSDSHGPGYTGRIVELEPDLREIGIAQDDLWRPAPVNTFNPAAGR